MQLMLRGVYFSSDSEVDQCVISSPRSLFLERLLRFCVSAPHGKFLDKITEKLHNMYLQNLGKQH